MPGFCWIVGGEFFLEFVAVCFHLECRGLPGGNSLSFASPKESKQRKGDPQSGSLR